MVSQLCSLLFSCGYNLWTTTKLSFAFFFLNNWSTIWYKCQTELFHKIFYTYTTVTEISAAGGASVIWTACKCSWLFVLLLLESPPLLGKFDVVTAVVPEPVPVPVTVPVTLPVPVPVPLPALWAVLGIPVVLLPVLLVVAWPVPVPCRRVSNVIVAPFGCTNSPNAYRRRRLLLRVYRGVGLSDVWVCVCVIYYVFIVILQKSTLGGFGFDYWLWLWQSWFQKHRDRAYTSVSTCRSCLVVIVVASRLM